MYLYESRPSPGECYMSTACNNNVSPPSAQDSNGSSIMPAESVSLDHAEASSLKSHAQVEYHDVRCRSSQGDHESEKSMNMREATKFAARLLNLSSTSSSISTSHITPSSRYTGAGALGLYAIPYTTDGCTEYGYGTLEPVPYERHSSPQWVRAGAA